MNNKLIQFSCPKCGRILAWAQQAAMVYCKACDRWVKANQIKNRNPAKMDPENKQLTLFE